MRDALYFLEYLSNAGIDPLEADEQVIQGYVEHLHDLKRSPTTISRNLASVRCFYKFLIFRGLMDSNPAKGIKLEKTVKKLPQVLSGEEIELLLAQPDITEPKGCRDKAMLELLYATGIRASELINLNIQDLNLPLRCPVLPGQQGGALHPRVSFGGGGGLRLHLPHARAHHRAGERQRPVCQLKRRAAYPAGVSGRL